MDKKFEKFDAYFAHLSEISILGKLYKRYFIAPLLYLNARKFGKKIVEIGSGVGSGLIGAYPRKVVGLEINPQAVKFCQKNGLNVQLIQDKSPYPILDESVDVCVLDNVLEHLETANFTLSECSRVVHKNGGLVIAVPGKKGYAFDSDHKIFYDEKNLKNIHPDWTLCFTFTTPFFIKSAWLSSYIKQYCIIAVYRKL